MKSVSSWVNLVARPVGAVLPLALLGCVPYQTYEMVKSEKVRLQSAHDDLKTSYNRALQDILRMQRDGASSQVLLEKVANLEALNNDLKAKLGQLAKGTPFTEKDLENLPKNSGVEIEEGGLRLGENILFNPGEATLKNATAREILDGIAGILQGRSGEIIHLTGHTDSDPLLKTKVRWDTNPNLGYQRAYTVFKFFLDKGLPENRMVLHSLGYLKPVESNDTKEGKARNRRVVIELRGTKL